MQRINLVKKCCGGLTFAQTRYLATVKDVFPNKIDFPTRHIGPRKTEVVAMLDLLGYKVKINPRPISFDQIFWLTEMDFLVYPHSL